MSSLPRIVFALLTLLGVAPVCVVHATKAQPVELPDAARVWTAADYQKLKEAIESGAVSHPRQDDPATAAVFARTIDPENYRAVMTTGDLSTRLRAAGALHAAVTQLFGAYVDAYDKQNASVQNEVAALYRFLVTLTVGTQPLWKEVRTLVQGTPKQAELAAALKQADMHPDGYLAVTRILNKGDLTNANKVIMAQALTELIGSRMTPMAAEDVRALREMTGRLLRSTRERELKNAFNALSRASEAIPVEP